jgi:hypothetical protein
MHNFVNVNGNRVPVLIPSPQLLQKIRAMKRGSILVFHGLSTIDDKWIKYFESKGIHVIKKDEPVKRDEIQNLINEHNLSYEHLKTIAEFRDISCMDNETLKSFLAWIYPPIAEKWEIDPRNAEAKVFSFIRFYRGRRNIFEDNEQYGRSQVDRDNKSFIFMENPKSK